MCGIIGINSNKPVSSTIINSLKKLEYRGYDSAGIATLSGGLINEVKSEGRVNNLEKNSLVKSMEGTIGIGHVRWATHGLPNSINAHPHSSQNVSVVHNGIIENSTLLKKFLVSKGHKFKSQTDTEVIVHLISERLKTDNIIDSVTRMKARGCQFLTIPPAYYDNLGKRLGEVGLEVKEDLEKIRELNLLVDFDEKGYLL